MKPITDEYRQELISHARLILAAGVYSKTDKLVEIALASLTADTSKLAELAAKVRTVREDASEFDGDRRGMWEYQEDQEQLLLEEAVKYTAPPVPVIKLPDEFDDYSHHLEEFRRGYNTCLAEIKRLNNLE